MRSIDTAELNGHRTERTNREAQWITANREARPTAGFFFFAHAGPENHPIMKVHFYPNSL